MNIAYRVTDETIRDFKLMLAKQPQSKIDKAFLDRFKRAEDEPLARCLIFFFLYINLNAIKDIKSFYVFLSETPFFRLKENRSKFRDERFLTRRISRLLF